MTWIRVATWKRHSKQISPQAVLPLPPLPLPLPLPPPLPLPLPPPLPLLPLLLLLLPTTDYYDSDDDYYLHY